MARELLKPGTLEQYSDSTTLPGWTIRWQTGWLDEGRNAVVGIQLSPADPLAGTDGRMPAPGNGITRRLLESAFRRTSVHWRQRRIGWVKRLMQTLEAEDRATRRPGRPRTRSVAWYRRLGARYDQRVRKGQSLRRLATEFKLTETAMRSAVRRCRKMGFIKTPAMLGRPPGL